MHPRIQTEAVAPTENEVGHVVSSPLFRNVIAPRESRVDPRKAMDDGKVLIVNPIEGRIGDDKPSLLGSLLVRGLRSRR